MAKIKVMIVEDELITGEAIGILLKKLNYDPIEIASSGEEAISKLEDLEPDLILMDIILAGRMDGIEAAQIINSKYDIPIIFITAYGDKKTLDKAKISEPYGYLVKPITHEDEIRPTIELAIYNHQIKKNLKKNHKKLEKIKEIFEPDYLPSQFKEPLNNENIIEQSSNISNPLLEFEIYGEKVTLIDWLKSFSNPERFLILELIKSQPLKLDEIKKCIGKSQPATSHHIKNLEDNGFIKGWKRGKYIYYSLDKPKIMGFVNLWENWIKNMSSN